MAKINISDKQSVLRYINLPKMMNKHFGREDIREGVVLCPFHEDTNPSLVVTRFNEVYRYKCKSSACNTSGNAFDFLEDHLHIKGFKEKIKWLVENNCLFDMDSLNDPTYSGTLIEKLTKALENDKSYEQEFATLADDCFKALGEYAGMPTESEVITHITDKFVIDLDHAIPLDIGVFNAERASALKLPSKFWKDLGLDFDKLKSVYKKCAILMLRTSKDTYGGFILSPCGLSSRDYRQYSYKGAKVFGGLQTIDLDGADKDSDYTIVVEGFSDMSNIQSRCLKEYGQLVNCISAMGTSGFNNKVSLKALDVIASYTRGNIAIFPDNDTPGIEAVGQMCQAIKGLHSKVTVMYPDCYEEEDDPADYTRKFDKYNLKDNYGISLDQSRYSVPEFFYRFATEQILRTGLDKDLPAAQELYAQIGVKAGLTNLDLDNYCEFACNGLPIRKTDINSVDYPILVTASKQALLQEISNNCTSFREMETPEGSYVIQNDSVHRVTTKMDAQGNETKISKLVANFSFQLRKVVQSNVNSRIEYYGDLTYRSTKGPRTKSNLMFTDDHYEPNKFLNTLAIKAGGTNIIAPTKSDERQRVRDICLMTWPDTIEVKSHSSYGYMEDPDTKELVHLLGSHCVTKTSIQKSDEYHVDTPADAGNYGYSLDPFTTREDLKASLNYCLNDVLWKVFPGQEHHITLPFMCALTAPLWYFNKNHKRFVLYTTGPYGCGKTQTQRLVKALMYRYESFHDSGMGFASTANYLEKAVACISDMLGVIDDYKEELSNAKGVVQLIQSLHDGQGRGRMTKDLDLAETNTSRCTLLMNGEDFPSLAQGASVSRVLYQVLPGKSFNYEPVEDITRSRDNYHMYQGWFPAYIQHVMKYGVEDADTSFTDGDSRISQHANMCFRAWRTFRKFCIDKAGFAADDPTLLKYESACRQYLIEVTNATIEKSVSETKWALFRRGMIQLLLCEKATLRCQSNTSGTYGSTTVVGTLLKKSASGTHKTYLFFVPEVALSLLRRELHTNLSTSGVFAAMKSDKVTSDLKHSNGVKRSSEKGLWIVNADKFFDSDQQADQVIKLIESNAAI